MTQRLARYGKTLTFGITTRRAPWTCLFSFGLALSGCSSSDPASPADAGSADSDSRDAGPCRGIEQPRILYVTALLDPPPSYDVMFMSSDGAVVAGTLWSSGGGEEGFRWTAATGVVRLGFTPSTDASHVSGLSTDGAVVVGTSWPMGFVPHRAFRWTESSGIAALGTVSSDSGTAIRPVDSLATAVSGDGSVIIGSYQAGARWQTFRWTAASSMVLLDPPAGQTATAPDAISADGSTVIGHSGDVGPSQGLRWAAGGWETMGPMTTELRLVSADGSVVAGVWYSGTPASQFASRWTASSGLKSLGVLPDRTASRATGMSADGSVIIGSSSVLAPIEVRSNALAFRWTETSGMTALARLPHPATELSANDAALLSADGSTVIGYDLTKSSPQGPFEERRIVIWDDHGAPQELGLCLVGSDGQRVEITPYSTVLQAISADGAVVVGGSNKRAADGSEGEHFGWIARLR